MVSVLRPGQRHIKIPGIGVRTSRRAVGSGNGLLNNLIAYWALDEAGGANNALDKHSNALTLTQVSSPGADTGKVYATARSFDGTGDYFTRTSEALLQTGDIDFTLCAWVYIADKTLNRRIVSKRSSATVGDYDLYYLSTDDRFHATVCVNGISNYDVPASTFGAPPANTWIFIVARKAGSTLYISANNGAEDSINLTQTITTSTAPFYLGQLDYADRKWNGRIGPVAMWKSAAGAGGALTAAQRTALYAGGAGLPYASFTT